MDEIEALAKRNTPWNGETLTNKYLNQEDYHEAVEVEIQNRMSS